MIPEHVEDYRGILDVGREHVEGDRGILEGVREHVAGPRRILEGSKNVGGTGIVAGRDFS